MSFHHSAEDIRIDDKHFLRASLRNENGDLVEAEFDLDTVIGNSEGLFYPPKQTTYDPTIIIIIVLTLYSTLYRKLRMGRCQLFRNVRRRYLFH